MNRMERLLNENRANKKERGLSIEEIRERKEIVADSESDPMYDYLASMGADEQRDMETKEIEGRLKKYWYDGIDEEGWEVADIEQTVIEMNIDYDYFAFVDLYN